MPAEWAKHEAKWLSWPKNPLTFPEDTIGSVEDIYCHMITSALKQRREGKIRVDDDAMAEKVVKRTRRAGERHESFIPMKIKSAEYGTDRTMAQPSYWTKKRCIRRW